MDRWNMLLPLALGALLTATQGKADNGTLAVQGEIIAPTCKVLGVIAESAVDSGSPVLNATFALNNLSENNKADNSFIGFQIQLSHCYATARHNLVSLFMSSPYADEDGYLRNALPDGPQGSVVMLYSRNLERNGGFLIPVGRGRSTQAMHTLEKDGIVRFGFSAMAVPEYHKEVTPGPFSTLVNYEVQYQ